MSESTSKSPQVCEHSFGCPLFPILSKSNALEYWKRSYCEGDYQRCARFEKMSKGLLVEPNLLPNGKRI